MEVIAAISAVVFLLGLVAFILVRSALPLKAFSRGDEFEVELRHGPRAYDSRRKARVRPQSTVQVI
jgi:hypothetical protein